MFSVNINKFNTTFALTNKNNFQNTKQLKNAPFEFSFKGKNFDESPVGRQKTNLFINFRPGKFIYF